MFWFGLVRATSVAILTVPLLQLAGCERRDGGSGPSGPSSGSQAAGSPTQAGVEHAPILDPFQGHWVFDQEGTDALRIAAGAKQADLDKERELLKKMPGLSHPDLILKGNVGVEPVTFMGQTREGELLFFALHEHGEWVCGKAWRHEDRNDPGDMSKCHVRLKIKDGRLELLTREQEGSVDLSDADLQKMPLAEGSAETCKADGLPAKDWSPWMPTAYKRKTE